MISDATLIHRFTGGNRHYVMVWSNGETAYFRASNMREAKKIAREFTIRLTDLDLVSVGKDE
jgi:hypothetical protein